MEGADSVPDYPRRHSGMRKLPPAKPQLPGLQRSPAQLLLLMRLGMLPFGLLGLHAVDAAKSLIPRRTCAAKLQWLGEALGSFG
jgi:hypothetical protein